MLAIDEEGVRFRSYLDGSERFMGPETSMEVQAALGSDIALAFDECTPFHVERDYTARSMERTHRWLDRCVAWHREHGPEGQLLFGIVQGGVYEDLRAESGAYVAAAPVAGIAIGGSLGQDKEEMREVVGWSLRGLPDERPRHLLGIGDVDDIVHAVGAGIDTFDCATPDPAGAPRHRAGAGPRGPLAARPGQAGHRARAASRSPRAAPARPAASTPAATCTT